MLQSLKALLHSRKFLLAIVAVLQIFVVQGLGLSEEIWQGIAVILIALIGSIAHEDGMAKRADTRYIPYVEEE